MKKRGFTLIELLAIIIILAVILVIAVPKITDVVKLNKEESFFSSAKSILRSIEYDSIKTNSMKKVSLASLNLDNISIDNYDTNNSFVYMLNDTIYIDLVGKGKFNDMVLCHVNSNSVSYELFDDSCSNVGFINLTVDLSGGVINNDISGAYLEGTNIILETPSKDGEVFERWEVVTGEGSVIGQNTLTIGSEDTNIKAIWGTKKSLTVDLDGGTCEVSLSGLYNVGTTFTLYTPEKQGFEFIGWQVITGHPSISGNTITMGPDDTIIKAKWNRKIQIDLDLNGGSINEDISGRYDAGVELILEDPVRLGYRFDGWDITFGDSVLDNHNLTVVNDTTLTALWTSITYNIIYHSNGGTGTMENSSLNYGFGQKLTPNAFTKDNDIFQGWSLEESSSLISYTDNQIFTPLSNKESNTYDLYAVWNLYTCPTGTTLTDGGTLGYICAKDAAGANYECNCDRKDVVVELWSGGEPYYVTQSKIICETCTSYTCEKGWASYNTSSCYKIPKLQ